MRNLSRAELQELKIMEPREIAARIELNMRRSEKAEQIRIYDINYKLRGYMECKRAERIYGQIVISILRED